MAFRERVGLIVIFTKNVTYLLHGVAGGIGVKWRKWAENWQTIGLGSDDF